MMAVPDAISNIIPGWWVNGSCRKWNVRVIGRWTSGSWSGSGGCGCAIVAGSRGYLENTTKAS